MSAFAILFAAIAASYAKRFHVDVRIAVGIYACFVVLLSLAFLPSMRTGRVLLARIGPGWRHLWVFPLLWIPYLLYTFGADDFSWTSFLRVAALALIPPLLYLLLPPRDVARFSGSDFLVSLLLIYVVLGGLLRGIWTIPVNLDFMGRLLLIAVCSIMWTSVRPVPALNYRSEITLKVLNAAVLNFLYFAVIAIPASLLIGFTAWHPRWHGFGAFCLDYLEIFLFIALLEEMFFRGFLQSLLTASFGSRVSAQLAVSILFGLFHILHAPFPNWRYVALATLAGWFYGEAYTLGGTLFASALTHAMVDTVWRTWFSNN
jgi:hypothetical protein